MQFQGGENLALTVKYYLPDLVWVGGRVKFCITLQNIQVRYVEWEVFLIYKMHKDSLVKGFCVENNMKKYTEFS